MLLRRIKTLLVLGCLTHPSSADTVRPTLYYKTSFHIKRSFCLSTITHNVEELWMII